MTKTVYTDRVGAVTAVAIEGETLPPHCYARSYAVPDDFRNEPGALVPDASVCNEDRAYASHVGYTHAEIRGAKAPLMPRPQ